MTAFFVSIYCRYITPYWKYILVTVVFAIIILVVTGPTNNTAVIDGEQIKPVRVATPSELVGSKRTELIGTVAAKTQANLQTEVGGRLTSVAVTLGQSVQTGQIVATIENASEQAGVLQAQGAYEAALANTASGDVGTRMAETSFANAKQAVKSANDAAFGVVQTVLFNTIDVFYANPSGLYPTLRISTYDQNEFLRTSRLDFKEKIEVWRNFTFGSATSDYYNNATVATSNLDQIIAMIDALTASVNNLKNEGKLNEEVRASYQISLSNARAQVVGAKSALQGAVTGLKAAAEGLERAAITSSGGAVSLSDAQVKQSLGVLRAAEANLDKTIIRTPIAGEVNSLYLKTGDYVSVGTPVARIANNAGLEITTYIGENERELLKVGSALLVENAGTGTVTNISPALDTITGKTEVRIAINNNSLKNGDSVRLFITEAKADKASATILIPLAAIKFEADQAYVFRVIDGVLTRIDVELGLIQGDTVVINSGIEADTEIVTDARGLVAGSKVTILTK